MFHESMSGKKTLKPGAANTPEGISEKASCSDRDGVLVRLMPWRAEPMRSKVGGACGFAFSRDILHPLRKTTRCNSN